jgi:glycine cleavage system H protein
MAREEAVVWRVGFTKFATRMLGDFVEFGFEVKEGQRVEVGQAVGWVEGFKAITELYCVMAGEFVGGNPELERDITLADADPYGRGWLYKVRGEPEAGCLDVHQYIEILNLTIDKIKEKTGGDVSEATDQDKAC